MDRKVSRIIKLYWRLVKKTPRRIKNNIIENVLFEIPYLGYLSFQPVDKRRKKPIPKYTKQDKKRRLLKKKVAKFW